MLVACYSSSCPLLIICVNLKLVPYGVGASSRSFKLNICVCVLLLLRQSVGTARYYSYRLMRHAYVSLSCGGIRRDSSLHTRFIHVSLPGSVGHFGIFDRQDYSCPGTGAFGRWLLDSWMSCACALLFSSPLRCYCYRLMRHFALRFYIRFFAPANSLCQRILFRLVGRRLGLPLLAWQSLLTAPRGWRISSHFRRFISAFGALLGSWSFGCFVFLEVYSRQHADIGLVDLAARSTGIGLWLRSD